MTPVFAPPPWSAVQWTYFAIGLNAVERFLHGLKNQTKQRTGKGSGWVVPNSMAQPVTS